MLDLCSDDATLERYGSGEHPFADIWRGRAGAQEWLTQIATTIEFQASERREFYAQDHTVIVVGYEKGTGAFERTDCNGAVRPRPRRTAPARVLASEAP